MTFLTPADWTSGKPREMLAWLQDASPRKLRLFSVACCGSLLRVLDNPRCWKLVEVAERFADGLTTDRQLEAARSKFRRAWLPKGHDMENAGFKWDAWKAIFVAAGGKFASDPAVTDPFYHANETIWYVSGAISQHPTMPMEEDLQADLLRCIFGNPYRPAKIEPSLLTDSVMKVARTIYEDKVFDRMPILGDALEECGVTDGPLLAHFRTPTPHARGCHVLDLVLGKD